MANPEWFGPANLATFGGSSLAVSVLVNTFRKLATKKWSTLTTQRVVFVICLLITAFAVGLQSPKDLLKWFLIPLNASLLFCTALGMNELGNKTTPRKHSVIEESRFFESWIK